MADSKRYLALEKINVDFGRVQGPVNIESGREFELEKVYGDHLIKAGLAKEIKAAKGE